VARGQVVAFEVKPFVPKLKITEAGQEQTAQVKLKVGALQIQSVPIECAITIPGLGLERQAKTKDQWLAEEVPTGKYNMKVEALGKTLEYEVLIEEGDRAGLLFNFITGQVEDRTAARRAAEAAKREADRKQQEARDKEWAKLREEAQRQGIVFPPGWVFLPIQPGTFRMGSPQNETGRQDNERIRTVTLAKRYWMGAYEVTQQQYEEIMGANPSRLKGSTRPVDVVSWNDAQDFLRKFNERERQAKRLPANWAYRLPTEAEWEYACRAGSTAAYCFGDDEGVLGEYAWYDRNSEGAPSAVGQKRPNAWGLYDMHGNVAEWCAN